MILAPQFDGEAPLGTDACAEVESGGGFSMKRSWSESEASTEAEEGPAKAPRTHWRRLLSERAGEALRSRSREEMMSAVFDIWDRDGSGEVDFEELLPWFMKATNQVEKDEPEVRASFRRFMLLRGKDPALHGLTPQLFAEWLSRASDEQVATQYVVAVEGLTDEPYSMNVDLAVDKAYEGRPLREILDAPTSAIQGVSAAQAEVLQQLGLRTIRDMGSWKFFILARAVVVLASKEEHRPQASGGLMNIRHALDRQYESRSLQQVLHLPPSAFNMFSETAGSLLEKLNIKSIQQLGRRKVFAWANAMVDLERYESLP